MGGGATDLAQIGADLGLEPSVLEHRRDSPPRPFHGFRESDSLPIPDELLAEILLRLPTPTDLIRASAACVSFRRVAADRSFPRRFRKLHAPPFLGFLECRRKVFHPAVPPYPSAPEASAAAADFSFSFLPAPASRWLVRDVRDGRVLLDRVPRHNDATKHQVVFPELVACDPLHRRYLLLPPIPAHLTATVKRPFWTRQHRYCETFLAASPVAVDQASETSFSVVWMAQSVTKLYAFVFSSVTGQWRAISSSQRWSGLSPGLVVSSVGPLFSRRTYAYGCFYWVTDWREKLLVLDIQRMEFSIAEPPPEATWLHGADVAFVEAGEGRLGMFIRPQHTNDSLNYCIRHNSCGGSSSRWQFERTVSLGFQFSIMASTSHLFLYTWVGSSPAFFSLDAKTLQLHRVFVKDFNRTSCYIYSNFPPSLLSTPTISSGELPGDGKEAEKETLEQGCAASSSVQSLQPSE